MRRWINMEFELKNKFKAEINGVTLYDEQSYDYL